MTTDSDLIKLYSQRILALAADIPHRGRLDARRPACANARRFAGPPSASTSM
jgi:hypothetical protein